MRMCVVHIKILRYKKRYQNSEVICSVFTECWISLNFHCLLYYQHVWTFTVIFKALRAETKWHFMILSNYQFVTRSSLMSWLSGILISRYIQSLTVCNSCCILLFYHKQFNTSCATESHTDTGFQCLKAPYTTLSTISKLILD